ncbi:MAG: hypothetical protein ACP5DQ_13240, partial [Bacteroidales bacterium]
MLKWNKLSWRLYFLDLAKGLKTKDYLRIFQSSFDWSYNEVREYQNNKLRELVEHAYNNTVYYKTIFDENGITPADIRTVDDLGKIPVLDREDFIDNYSNLIDKKNRYAIQFPSSSSGTTGTPLKYIHDKDGESAGIAGGYALYNLSGWWPGDRTLHIWGNPASIKKWNTFFSKAKRKLLNQINYPAFLLNNPENYPHLLELIYSQKPYYIDGYASSIGSFAAWLAKKNKKIDGIKAVFTTAENLTQVNKENIEKYIGPVSDLYGCGEINGIAIQPINHEEYYVLDTHVIVETVEINGIKELVVTDLDNRIMPFIRYKIGDTVDGIYAGSAKRGLHFSRFKKLEGRISDYIQLPSGKIIHPVTLLGGTFLRSFPSIKRHKVIWNGSKMRFLLESNEYVDIQRLK